MPGCSLFAWPYAEPASAAVSPALTFQGCTGVSLIAAGSGSAGPRMEVPLSSGARIRSTFLPAGPFACIGTRRRPWSGLIRGGSADATSTESALRGVNHG